MRATRGREVQACGLASHPATQIALPGVVDLRLVNSSPWIFDVASGAAGCLLGRFGCSSASGSGLGSRTGRLRIHRRRRSSRARLHSSRLNSLLYRTFRRCSCGEMWAWIIRAFLPMSDTRTTCCLRPGQPPLPLPRGISIRDRYEPAQLQYPRVPFLSWP